MVTRQLSMWPFAARVARLFLVVDPSLADQTLRNGLLRAMQQAYFGSDGYSQTRAVREAALAAHYVLRHHNRDVLPMDQINAASAVAAVRGDVAFLALAGHAAAFAWRGGELTEQRGILRLPRPLGLEQDPAVTLWRTSLRPGDRLALVCGATWRPDSQRAIETILSEATSTAAAEERLAEALSDTRPAGILVVAPASPSLRVPHLRLLPGREQAVSTGHVDAAAATPPQPLRRRLSPARWIVPVLGLVLLAMMALATFAILPPPGTPPTRIRGVSPRTAIRLGPQAASVVDLAVGDAALYTLDVAEGAVRAFSLDALEQRATPETLLARAGTSIDTLGGQLTLPIAIEYLPGLPREPGSLAIVDQSRAVVQVARDRSLNAQALPTSARWQELGALGSGGAGELLFLDSGSHEILEYPAFDHAVVDTPRLILDAVNAPRLPFDHVAQIISAGEGLVVRLDDGSIHLLDTHGADRPLPMQSTDAAPLTSSAMAPDRAGGLYLADPHGARVVQTKLDGVVQRELRAPELTGIRAMDVSLDGRRLYALIDSGILVVDIPAE